MLPEGVFRLLQLPFSNGASWSVSLRRSDTKREEHLMKRNVIIAVAAAAAVIGGGTLVGTALGSDEDPAGGSARTEQSSSAFAPASNDEVMVGADADDTDDADADREGDARDDDGSPAPGAGPAFERAMETATTAAPGVVTDIEFDRNDAGGRAAWEIELWGEDGQWHRVWVSRDGTEVLDNRSFTTDDDGDDHDDQDDQNAAEELLNDSGVQITEAIRLAEDRTSAAFREAGLDDGRWNVDLRGDDGTEYEVEIDLATGEIASEEQDSDQNDDDGVDDQDDQDDHPEDDGYDD
jgi:uncharacterized membrane protein YkoI